MYAFDYRRPGTLGEADLALKAAPGAKLLAGGQTLIPAMKLRLAEPGNIVDLGAIGQLKGISKADGALRIGAMTTHAAVAESAEVKAAIPGLAALAGGIGDPHVRNRGTIGGSVANNDPAADYPAGVLALNATVHTTKRAIPADQLFTGLFSTALEDNEIVTHIDFPVPQSFTYVKFANPASRYALVGVAVARTAGGVRVAVTGAGASGVFRLTDAEKALSANFSAKALDGVKIDASNLMSDIHAAADYRAHLIGVMLRRAVG
ncbi:MAG: xanthine dehydrogenase family protein subunit M [Hyphomicrobiaceae bacterium]